MMLVKARGPGPASEGPLHGAGLQQVGAKVERKEPLAILSHTDTADVSKAKSSMKL